MTTFFMLKNFKQWLKQNRQRFNHPPFITMVNRRGFSISFTGFDPRISCHVSAIGFVEIVVHYESQLIDIIAEYDVIPRKDSHGRYFCKLCRMEDPSSATYASRSELVATHTWELLLEWANDNAPKSVCVYGMGGGSTWAKVKSNHEIEQAQAEKGFINSLLAAKRPPSIWAM